MADCKHEHELLSFNVQGQARGGSPSFHLKCQCGRIWTGSPAIQHVLGELSHNTSLMWQAIRHLGGVKPEPPEEKVVGKKKCHHFTSWLKVEVAGRSAHGHSQSFHVRCRGCKQSWGMALGFKLLYERLAKEQAELWKAIKALS